MPPPPNLFDYATKELSQDAVICWLIKWSTARGDADLQALGRRFVESLLTSCSPSNTPLLGGQVQHVCILQQERRIDVLAQINRKHVLLIEDKTDSDPHGDQLCRYKKEVLAGRTTIGAVSDKDLFPVYLKTGNQSRASEQEIAHAGYGVFDRSKFLEVLNSYRGDHPIVSDFRSYLSRIERETKSCRSWRQGDERVDRWEPWQGLYRELEELMFSDRPRWNGWGYVPNRAGGFLGFWWKPKGLQTACPAYVQLEWDKLCFKVEATAASTACQDKLKFEWCERLTRHANWIVKPRVLRRGRTMTVAVANPDEGWLRYNDEGALDVTATVGLLREAECALQAAAKKGLQ